MREHDVLDCDYFSLLACGQADGEKKHRVFERLHIMLNLAIKSKQIIGPQFSAFIWKLQPHGACQAMNGNAAF